MNATLESPELTPRQGGAHLARTVAIVVGVVVVALVALLATRKSSDDQVAKSEVVGKAVPAVAGTTLNGAHFDVDDHLGQWVVIDFFGSWCVPCQAEQGELVKFAQQHHDDPDVAMVGIMYSDKKADAQAFYQRTGATWPILDDDGSTALSFGVTGVPETYVVSPNGQVVAKFEAGITAAALDDVIARYGGEPSTTVGAGLLGRGLLGLVDHHLGRHAMTDRPSAPGGATSRPSEADDRSVGHLLRMWGPWVLMAVIVVTALTIGITGNTGPTTNEGRMLAIASTLKCEVCEGETVAQSDSDFAQQARVEIAKRLDEGQSDSQIRAFFIQTDGADVSLNPSSSGVSGLVWIIPVVALILSGAVLVMVFRRWQVRGDVHASAADRELVAAALADLDEHPDAGSAGQADLEAGS